MNAVTEPGAINWAVREAEAQLLYGDGGVSTATLRRLVEQEASRSCLGDPEAWFPVRETSEVAAALCDGCRVRELCLELALRQPGDGIWGGTTTRDRDRQLQRRRRPEMTAAAAADGTVEQLAAARVAAAAAVRVSATGEVSVRMPRLGSVRHPSVEAALRGCPCHPCDRTRDDLHADLLGDQNVHQVEVEGLGTPPISEPPAEQPVAGVDTERVDGSPVPAADADPAPERPVVDLPAGLVVDLPAGISAAAGLAARRVVQGHAVDDADCTRLLLILGLATELEAAGAASDTGPAGEVPLGDAGAFEDVSPGLVDLEADGGRGAAA